MQLRKLTEADASLFFDLRLEGLKESPTAFGESDLEFSERTVESIADTISSNNKKDCNFLLGAFDTERELVGVLGLARQQPKKMEHYCILWGMYVSPKSRRQGVGQALLQDVIRIGKEAKGVQGIKLCVVENNLSALKLYQLAGFSQYGIEPKAIKLDGLYYDEHLMLLSFD